MNNNVEFVKDFWGDALIPIKIEKSLVKLLPKQTTYYLQEVGLPDLSRFPPEADLFNFKITEKQLFEYGGQSYINIKTSGKQRLCIQADSGAIYNYYGEIPFSIGEDEIQHTMLFVNQDIIKFIIYLTQILSFESKNQGLFDSVKIHRKSKEREGFIALVEQLEIKLSKIDSHALGSEARWWYWELFDLKYM